MIDLHLHTTASDGFDSPEELVEKVARAGIRVFAVTDHDTTAGLDSAKAAAAVHGLGWIPGIEITAVEGQRDVHVLGYGFDVHSPTLVDFLAEQRSARLDRLRTFGDTLARLGMPFDVDPLIARAAAAGGRTVGRAHVARALMAAGHASSVEEAFASWLSPGRPGFVARRGAPVVDVVRRLADAGGIASLAHPLLVRDDQLVERLLHSGVHALEAFHTEHDAATTTRYLEMARQARLAVSGGTDFHGDTASRRRQLNDVSLPADVYRGLCERAMRMGTHHRWPHV